MAKRDIGVKKYPYMTEHIRVGISHHSELSGNAKRAGSAEE